MGGNIIEYLGWRATFYSVIPIAFLLIIIIIRHVNVKEYSQILIQEQQETLYESPRDERCIHLLAKAKKFAKSLKEARKKYYFITICSDPDTITKRKHKVV
jgi:hypothetical protein